MQDQHALQPGSILDRYRIIRVLGEGGFGITYLAEDIQLGLKVVIKEYFPNEFAMRSGDSTITAKNKSVKDFSKGKQRFKEEAQTLAKFNHPSIVKILGYFEANDTAYFVMEYEEGIDLSQYLKQENKPFTQEEILSIMMPILEGLKEVHKYNYLHRDIKPGNILLRTNKSPVLIDFGASKLALGEASKSITSMLTEGYAPLEQYSTDVKRQGSFTDLYATAAVMYKMITGDVPPSAQTRSYQLLSDDNDPLKLLINMNLSGYDRSFLNAIDRALSIKGKDRPQNVQEFQADLAGKLKVESIKKVQTPNNVVTKKKSSGIIILLLVLLIIGGGYYFFTKNHIENESKIADQAVSSPIASNVSQFTNEDEIEAERLKKEYEEIQKLRKDKALVQKEELESLRKEKIKREKNSIKSNKHIATIINKMWQDEPANRTMTMTWLKAMQYCQDLDLGGYHDWRLPSRETLKELYTHKSKLKNVSLGFSWSSTTANFTSGACSVYFIDGDSYGNYKASSLHLRCVRGGQ